MNGPATFMLVVVSFTLIRLPVSHKEVFVKAAQDTYTYIYLLVVYGKLTLCELMSVRNRSDT